MTRPFSEESAYSHKLIGDPNHDEIARYLDTVGDGSGSNVINTTPNTFRLKPPDGTLYIIDKIRLVGWDDILASAELFIGISALTTGCKLEIRSQPGSSPEKVIQDLTGGELIKSNGDLACLGDLLILNDATLTRSLVQCIIKPEAPYRIEGKRGESLVFQTQVTLAGLLGFRVMAIGRKYSNSI